MPFVENCDFIEPVLYELLTVSALRDGIKNILELYQDYKISVKQINAHSVEKEAVALTAREMQVARLAADGATNNEIGKQLYITENTVKSALKSIYSKLSINNKTLLKQYMDKAEHL